MVDNENIKCHHIVLIVKKAFEGVNSLSNSNEAKIVYSRIQQSLNKDKIFSENERYEILEFVSTMIFQCSHENMDVKIECMILCSNIVSDMLATKAKADFMEYQMKTMREIDIKTQEIVNPYFKSLFSFSLKA